MIIFPDISPEIFTISIGEFEFALRWYAMAYIVGIVLAWRISVAAVRRPQLWPNDAAPLAPEKIEDLVSWLVLGIILGGRLGYALFYQPAYYLDNPFQVLRIWDGGMSFHGGLIGVILAAYLYFRKWNVPILSGSDMIAMGVPVGLLLGRIANFINAELWGRPTDVPWAVAFPGWAAQNCGQPVGELCGRHPSQLYEAGLEGLVLGLILLVMVFWRRALKRPGRVTGVFFLGYGAARCFVEMFRQPDAQFQTPSNPLGYAVQMGEFGITMGQIMSLPMIALGLYLILASSRKV
jgi:phosphatidylglycerol:prolipoprotein diacylglycerol transferase